MLKKVLGNQAQFADFKEMLATQTEKIDRQGTAIARQDKTVVRLDAQMAEFSELFAEGMYIDALTRQFRSRYCLRHCNFGVCGAVFESVHMMRPFTPRL